MPRLSRGGILVIVVVVAVAVLVVDILLVVVLVVLLLIIVVESELVGLTVLTLPTSSVFITVDVDMDAIQSERQLNRGFREMERDKRDVWPTSKWRNAGMVVTEVTVSGGLAYEV